MSRLDTLRRLGLDPYPARCGRTHTVRQTLAASPPPDAATLAGRLIHADLPGRTGVLEDATGRMPFHLEAGAAAPLWPHLAPGDLVACTGAVQDSALAVQQIRLLAPYLGEEPASIPPAAVVLRAHVLRHTRRFFEERGFLGVETPTLLTVPDLTPALRAFQTLFRDDAGRTLPLYLHTSPEHGMKRLLAAGYERLYQICRFYRNGERFDAHHPEFTGLEWYEAYADYHHIMRTTEEYIASLAVALTGAPAVAYRGQAIDLTPPWPRQTVRDAFLSSAGIDLNDCAALADFKKQAARRRFEVRPDDTWDDLFHRLFAQTVEPHLPADRPLFLTGYPAPLPSLAKRSRDDPRYVERFELYIGKLELANAFTELNDPEEQRARFEAQRRIKHAQEGYAGGVDEALLAALAYGMPPAGGIAVGLDRLMMLFADAPTIDGVMAFRNS
jgi:EF-P lysine aminoacylase GenX